MTHNLWDQTCYDDNDWLEWVFSYVLFYPTIVWGGFFVCGFIFSSPVLLYISKVSGLFTLGVCYGLARLLRFKRPPGQDCAKWYAFPDVPTVVSTVNVLTFLGIVMITRIRIHWSSVLVVGITTLLYFVALYYNHYLTAMQIGMNLGASLIFSAVWITTYALIARPLLLSWNYRDSLLIGSERDRVTNIEIGGRKELS